MLGLSCSAPNAYLATKDGVIKLTVIFNYPVFVRAEGAGLSSGAMDKEWRFQFQTRPKC
jgi:hypothetical protein